MFLRSNRTFTYKQNHLLAALPAADYERLLPHLELAPLPFGLALYDSGSAQRNAYFPTTSIASMLYVMQDGSSAEIAVVGNEGVVGIAQFMGGESTTSRAVVQSAGYAYRLGANVLKEEFDRGGPLQHLLLRYTQALIAHMAQTAVCNRRHSIAQQLCRSLLLSLDRLPSNEVTTTHELISNMLGVRREGVAEAAGKLRAAGVIDYSRGKITVLDRAGLEAQVCECYAVVKRESDRLLCGTTAIVDQLPGSNPSPRRRHRAAGFSLPPGRLGTGLPSEPPVSSRRIRAAAVGGPRSGDLTVLI
jgi:CRP-like cAMP-binding protein